MRTEEVDDNINEEQSIYHQVEHEPKEALRVSKWDLVRHQGSSVYQQEDEHDVPKLLEGATGVYQMPGKHQFFPPFFLVYLFVHYQVHYFRHPFSFVQMSFPEKLNVVVDSVQERHCFYINSCFVPLVRELGDSWYILPRLLVVLHDILDSVKPRFFGRRMLGFLIKVGVPPYQSSLGWTGLEV